MGKSIGLILALKDQCSPQLTKIAEKLGISEKEAKKLHVEINRLSKNLGGKLKGACTAVGIGLGAVTAGAEMLLNKTVETTSRINDMSARIGVSKQAFQQWDYIMKQNGGDVESLQVGMKKLVGQIAGVNSGSKSSIKTFETLGVSVKDTNGHLKNQEQVFDEVMVALQKMPDGVMKAKIASDLFGKSGAQLMPILEKNSESISALQAEYKRLGIAISDETVSAGDDLGDTFDKLQSSFNVLGMSVGVELIPVMQKLSNTLLNNIPQIKSAVAPVIVTFGNTVKFAAEHLKGLSIIAGICLTGLLAYKSIQGVISIIQTYQQVVALVTKSQGLWNFVTLANPIVLVTAGIVAVIGIIVALVKNWDNVTRAVSRAINAMKAFVGIKGRSNVKTPNVEVKKNALGTSFYSGGSTRVNEFGGEIIDLPTGSRIYPANTTQKMMNGSAGQSIQIVIQGNVIGNQEFLNQLGSMFAQKMRVAMAVK